MANVCETTFWVYADGQGRDADSQLLRFLIESREAQRVGTLSELYRMNGDRDGEESTKSSTIYEIVAEAKPDGTQIGGVQITCHEKWEPSIYQLDNLLRAKYPNLLFTTMAVEPGTRLFLNTDIRHEHFKNQWHLLITGGGEVLYEECFDYDEESNLLDAIEDETGIRPRTAGDFDGSFSKEKLRESPKDMQAILTEFDNAWLL